MRDDLKRKERPVKEKDETANLILKYKDEIDGVYKTQAQRLAQIESDLSQMSVKQKQQPKRGL